MSENEFTNREQNEVVHPTYEEMLALIINSKLPKEIKSKLVDKCANDLSIQNKLKEIYNEIDRVYNTEEKDTANLDRMWQELNNL